MKTDVCTLKNDKSSLGAILAEAEKSAQYNGLSKKQTLQLRLLAEELAGMLPEDEHSRDVLARLEDIL